MARPMDALETRATDYHAELVLWRLHRVGPAGL